MDQLTELRPPDFTDVTKLVDLFKQIITGVLGRRGDCLSAI